MKLQSLSDSFLSISKEIGKSKSKHQMIDALTETVLLVEKELKTTLNEEQIAGILDYVIQKGNVK